MDFAFRGRMWRYEGGAGSWCFLTLPKDVSLRIREAATNKPGGSVRVTARIGSTRWKTSVFLDRARGAYLLPVKAAVRAKEQLRAEDEVDVEIRVEGPFSEAGLADADGR